MRRVGPALLVGVAALAAHSAWALAHLALAGAPRAAWPIALVPVLLWSVGMLRRSAATLLAGVPVSWALLAYLDDPRRFSVATGLTDVATLVAYLVAAALYLTSGERVAETPATVAWHPLDDAPARSPRPLTEAALPWLAGALVLGPGLGLLLSPGLEANLRQGFGPLAGAGSGADPEFFPGRRLSDCLGQAGHPVCGLSGGDGILQLRDAGAGTGPAAGDAGGIPDAGWRLEQCPGNRGRNRQCLGRRPGDAGGMRD